MTSKVGEPIDEKTLFEDAKAIREYYQKKGFQNTTVDYVPLINEDRGQGSVTFEIVEAPKVKIDKVLFKGNQAFSQRKLRKVIKTRNRWAFSWLTGSGIFKEDQFEEDKKNSGNITGKAAMWILRSTIWNFPTLKKTRW